MLSPDMHRPGQDELTLRAVVATDVAIFFEQQRDPEANHRAAFTAEDPSDRKAFETKWARILDDPTSITRTIVVGGEVVGNVMCFVQFGQPSVGYWIGREFWGRGLATRALAALLAEVETRPLHARVAKDNAASLRVLEKCGFAICGEDRGFAAARGAEIEEWLLELSPSAPSRPSQHT